MAAAEIRRRTPFDALSAYMMVAVSGALVLAGGVLTATPFSIAMGAWLLASVAIAVTRRWTSPPARTRSLTGDLGVDGWAAPAILGAGFVAVALSLILNR